MMKHTPSTFAYLTLLLWVVLLLPGLGKANLANYCRNDKGTSLQLKIVLNSRDTIPPQEEENFDSPFGAPEYQPYNPDPFADKKESPSKIIQAQKVEVEDHKPRLYKVPESYTGFKIEIKKAPKPLSASHDIFFQHGNLFAEKLQDESISYMLGAFSNADEANLFLSDFLIKRYPEARVVEYKAGSRLY